MPKDKKPAKAKRGKPVKAPRPEPPQERPKQVLPAGQTAAAPPPKFVPPSEFAFWNDRDHDELTEAWLALHERHQAFFKEWYSNGFHGTNAYAKIYGQENREAAAVNASQLLGGTNILRLRRAIWSYQIPPLERMAAIEREVLEADENMDPKLMRNKLLKLGAVQTMREYHRIQPASLQPGAEAPKAPTLKGTFELEITDGVKGLLNGGG